MLDKVNNFSVNPNTIAGNFSTFTDDQHSYWKEARALDRKSLWCYPGGHTDYWTPGKDKQALVKIVSAMSL